MLVERAARPLLGPDVAIDRFVTDREPLVTAKPARHLFRAPILAQELLDLRPLSGRELPIAAGGRAAAAGVPLRQLWPITIVAGRAVAPHFAPNRAPVAAEDARDRGRGEAALAEQAQAVSFCE